MRFHVKFALVTLLIALCLSGIAAAQDDAPPAPITNDEGGPVVITGTLSYTNLLFTTGVAQPIIILEDQAGFVDRNLGFLMPLSSQTIGQLTSDFYESPVSYSLALPIVPQGSYRDVDQDDQAEQGVQVFAVAYWNNVFGDPFLEERDLYGGGWSTAYASTRVSEDPDQLYEIVGGQYVVYAPDDQQGFPSGFGEDGLLFTEDDPIVTLPQGYTIVNLDTDPFTFDRSREPVIDLIEPEGAALDDFSGLSYTEAFDAMVEKMRTEYAFSEFKNIQWDKLVQTYRPRFEQADRTGDSATYMLALRDFLWQIPDGHVAVYPFEYPLALDFVTNSEGGLGIAIGETDDGEVIVTYVTPGSPAANAGMVPGTEILEIDGKPILDVISQTVPFTSPFSTEHVRRLNQLVFAVRFPIDTEVEVSFRTARGGGEVTTTTTLRAVQEWDSFDAAFAGSATTGYELPVEYETLDNGIVLASITAFDDNDLLTIQLWERLMQELNENSAAGLIVDMRSNGGGSGFLADQMAAYFFDEPLVLGNSGSYSEETGEFFFDTQREEKFYLPPEELRYRGPVAVLVGPDCASACEFFAYNMTLEDRATIVGHYPTAGLGGGINDFAMPDSLFVRFTVARAVNAEGEIHIEGQGVAPDIDVPVTVESLLDPEADPVLDAAIEALGG
jgi:C-terminal processing protease CtpA/Prc